MKVIPQEFERLVATASSLTRSKAAKTNLIWTAIKDTETVMARNYLDGHEGVRNLLRQAVGYYDEAVKSLGARVVSKDAVQKSIESADVAIRTAFQIYSQNETAGTYSTVIKP